MSNLFNRDKTIFLLTIPPMYFGFCFQNHVNKKVQNYTNIKIYNFILLFYMDCMFFFYSLLLLHVHQQTSFDLWITPLPIYVTTVTLGSRLKQGLVKVQAKSEARESHFMISRTWESVREWTPTLPSELPLWELESQWTHKSLERNWRGQNPSNWKVLGTKMSKMGLHDPFGHLKHKL